MSDYFIDYEMSLGPSELHFHLAHFTRDWETLQSIIEHGFQISYCTEIITDGQRTIRGAFPMVSFCSMGTDEALFRMKSYGTFAIVINNSWGMGVGLNSVSYLASGSSFAADIINGFDIVRQEPPGFVNAAVLNPGVGVKPAFLRLLINYFSITKNFYAPLERRGHSTIANYGFGFEREWRYVFKNEDFPLFLDDIQTNDKAAYNKLIAGQFLSFQPDDIEQLVVETDYQKNEAMSLFKKQFDYTFDPDKIKINTLRHKYSD